MKTCYACHLAQPIAEFYAHPGTTDKHLGICKTCVKARAAARRAAHLDEHRAKERERNQDPKRKAAIAARAKTWMGRFPDRRKAHNAVANALRDGKLTKSPCEVCGSLKVHAHHANYAKPLEVRWLCAIHHAAEHRP